MKILAKKFIKIIHGAIYQLLLPILVRPPGAWFQSEVYSIHRVNVMKFLQNWQPRIYGRVIDVGAGTWEFPRHLFQDVCEYTTTDHFEHPNVDVVCDIYELSDVLSLDTYDFAICTEVIEHTARPWLVVGQLHALLKPGGHLLLSTPFNFHLHGDPILKDYWRLTADGLRQLLVEEAGFSQVQIESKGHPRFPFSHLVVAVK